MAIMRGRATGLFVRPYEGPERSDPATAAFEAHQLAKRMAETGANRSIHTLRANVRFFQLAVLNRTGNNPPKPVIRSGPGIRREADNAPMQLSEGATKARAANITKSSFYDVGC